MSHGDDTLVRGGQDGTITSRLLRASSLIMAADVAELPPDPLKPGFAE